MAESASASLGVSRPDRRESRRLSSSLGLGQGSGDPFVLDEAADQVREHRIAMLELAAEFGGALEVSHKTKQGRACGLPWAARAILARRPCQGKDRVRQAFL